MAAEAHKEYRNGIYCCRELLEEHTDSRTVTNSTLPERITGIMHRVAEMFAQNLRSNASRTTGLSNAKKCKPFIERRPSS